MKNKNSDNRSNTKLRNSDWLSLGEDEEILAWSHPSIFRFMPMFLLSGLLVIIGITSPFFVGISGSISILTPFVLIVLGLFVMTVEYIRYLSEFYIFTSNRAITKRGILSQDVKKVSYEDVETMDKEYPIDGRILGYGSVILVSASPSYEDIRMDYLPEVNKATKIIGEYKSKRDKGVVDEVNKAQG